MKKVLKNIFFLIAVVLIFISYIPTLIDAFKIRVELSNEECVLVEFRVSRVYSGRSYGSFMYENDSYDAYFQDGGNLKKDDVINLYYYPTDNTGGLVELVDMKKTMPIALPLIIIILNTVIAVIVSISLYYDFSSLFTIHSIKKTKNNLETKKYKKQIRSQS